MDAKQILVLGASVLAAFSGGSAIGKDLKEPYVRVLPAIGENVHVLGINPSGSTTRPEQSLKHCIRGQNSSGRLPAAGQRRLNRPHFGPAVQRFAGKEDEFAIGAREP